MEILVAAAGFLFAINVVALAGFGLDKRLAVSGAWRLREAWLLLTALAGGWVGAKLGQRLFRHKTRKQPFGMILNGVVLFQAAIVGAWVWTGFPALP